MPDSRELEKICDALLAAPHPRKLAYNDSWRALKTVELGSIVARHLGSDADEDSKKLHRKLLRTSATYRAYTRLVEAIRILSEASAEFADPVAELASATDIPAQVSPNASGKPRIRVRAVSRLLPEPVPLPDAKARAA